MKLLHLINWIIKMAKKILSLDTVTGAKSWGSVDADNVVLDTTNFDKNLDTTITDVQKLADAVDDLELGGTQIQSDWNQTDGTQVDYIKNKPSGTSTVAKLFYFSGIPASSILSIYNTDLGLDSSVDLTTIEILCQLRTNNVDFYMDKVVGNRYTHKIYPNRIVFDNLSTSYSYIATVAINTEAIAEVTGGGSLPTGTENQTLRYNSSNELESTSTLTINDTNVNVDSELIIDKMTSAFSDLLLTVKSRSVDILSDTWFEIKADGGLYAKTLVGTGDRPVFADENGKLKVGTAPIPTKIEHLSTALTGMEYTVNATTLGITGDLRDRIKLMKVWIKNASGGDLRTDSTAGEYIGTDFISVDFNTDLSGNYVKIVLYIE